MEPLTVVNVAELSPGDAFVDLPAVDGRPLRWIGHSGLPANAIERRVRRPRLSRYRAAAAAARDGRHADALISHLPRMTAAAESFARLFGRRAPHLAFAFNFTKLPTGADRPRLTAAFARVEQFCVFSQHEIALYSDAFGLPPERFRPVIWSQSAPPVTETAVVPERPYAVAIGGEGRDFAALLEAARADPQIEWVVIARPNPLLEQAPPNMHVRYNLPLAETWGIAARAAAVAVPLLAHDTCCGHITIASTQLLGLPLVTTRSLATREYVEDFATTTVIDPGDADALAAAVRSEIDSGAERKAAAARDRAEAARRYDRATWADYVADFLRRHAVVG